MGGTYHYLAGMTDPFLLTVHYQGEDRDYTAQLIIRGYTHQFKITIDNSEVYFEPDEEGQYRAVQQTGQDVGALARIDIRLLALLQEQLAAIRS
jgi:uncharacterized membrane-anchored protein